MGEARDADGRAARASGSQRGGGACVHKPSCRRGCPPPLPPGKPGPGVQPGPGGLALAGPTCADVPVAALLDLREDPGLDEGAASNVRGGQARALLQVPAARGQSRAGGARRHPKGDGASDAAGRRGRPPGSAGAGPLRAALARAPRGARAGGGPVQRGLPRAEPRPALPRPLPLPSQGQGAGGPVPGAPVVVLP